MNATSQHRVSIEILTDTFGNQVESVYVNGLVDADDTDDFDAKVESVISKWRNCNVTSTSNMEGFITWFTTYKVPVIRNSMIRPVREVVVCHRSKVVYDDYSSEGDSSEKVC